MIHTEYMIAAPEDRAEIIDFANMVFSQNSAPHNFKTLLPKVYGDGAKDHSIHHVAKQDGRVRAVVAMLPEKLRVLDHTLNMGFVGTVSVHLYSRGEGHMKALMQQMKDDATQRGMDILVLGGQRQRYNYFGFEQAGTNVRYRIDANNIRHCLKNVDVSDITFEPLSEDRPEALDFAHALAQKLPVACDRPRDELLARLQSWHNEPMLVRIGGEPAGYIVGEVTEVVLTDEFLLLKVLKAYMGALKLKEIQLSVAPHQTERMRILSTLSGNRSISHVEMVNVLNWQGVLEAYLRLKASYTRLTDGRVTLGIDGEAFTISVENGVPTVVKSDCAPDCAMTKLEAERLVFDIEGALCPDPRFGNWFPLPFPLTGVDTF